MSIKLDWEIDGQVQSGIGEDPTASRKRRVRAMRLILFLLTVGVIVIGGFIFIDQRLNRLSGQLEIELRDTVNAEVTAIRLGDWEAYRKLQRSAARTWEDEQRANFQMYQDLFIKGHQVQLNGRILDLVIDNNVPRARVHVEEIIDGIAYTRIWFYWRYSEDEDRDGQIDGWRHTRPDYTFWGDAKTLNGQHATITYREVDARVAHDLMTYLDQMVELACSTRDCTNLPRLRADISPEGYGGIMWSPADKNLLLIPSPYVVRARSDMPFSPEMQAQVAGLLAGWFR
ncbi:MAG: hypothetical protein CUN52_11420 [Phototrophicales bacterium]|nr:MAG: hypothetical protein CUN52_11420 [Phototrophicales bacterium]